MMQLYDLIVVGAGVAGATISRLCAEDGKKVLIIEQKDYAGGCAHDYVDENGITVHSHGPHIFHTNDDGVFEFLTRFCSMNDFEHRVGARVQGEYIPVPFNLRSLDIAFGNEAVELGNKLLASYGMGERVPILELKKQGDPDLLRVADYVYNNIFLRYTTKQWGLSPEEVDPSVTGRVPISLSYDDRYFTDKWQGIPVEGYTKLFENLLDHENITLKTGIKAKELLELRDEGVFFDNKPFDGPVIYTGAIDELFDYCYGALPYRTLEFQLESHPQKSYQPYAVVNYTVDEDFTRITEFKKFTFSDVPNTTICKEYSKAYTGAKGETPYYPVASDDSRELYERYHKHSAKWANLHMLGRLAEFKYYNMDGAVSCALSLFENLKEVWR